ncbi:MAG: GNAT family N-acetyltransferase, partial [Bacillota bacterium]
GPPPAGHLVHLLLSHADRDGFRCVVAFLHEAPVGFAYGYTGRRGQWWTEQVARHLDGAKAREWLGDHFELVELHVHPSYQGQGIGGRLHDRLLEGLPHRRALLSTRQGPTVAVAMYRSRGWELVAGPIRFDGTDHPYLIFGKRLERGA